MHIALVSPLFEQVPPQLYGGTERIVDYLARGLIQKGVDVTVFASGDSQVPARLISPIDQALRLSSKEIRDFLPYHFKLLSQVAERASEFDVIHNHHDYWMLPLAQMTSTPLVTTTHGRLDLDDLPAAYLSFGDSAFIAISESQRRQFTQLPWMATIPHGIPVEQYRFSEEPGSYLAFLGRIDPSKGPDRAVEIAQRSGIPLKIAAKIEKGLSQEYFDYAIKPHVDGRWVEYIGEISEAEKSEFLGNALALCFPIDWPEPFGLVMVEALACGTPVLARPCGSVPEILVDGLTGFIDPGVSVLAQKVRDLGSIDRKSCRRWVENNFSLSRMTEDYVRVYRQLIESREDGHRRRNFVHSLERPIERNSKNLHQG
jgi:glycosyltransferase involved in cell wall biosynthesis